jgi:hypothetical protein
MGKTREISIGEHGFSPKMKAAWAWMNILRLNSVASKPATRGFQVD